MKVKNIIYEIELDGIEFDLLTHIFELLCQDNLDEIEDWEKNILFDIKNNMIKKLNE
jgi:hypothetical protein